MAVRKFRSVADMPGPPPRKPLDADNLRLAFDLMAFADQLNPEVRAPGVRRFRNYDDARRPQPPTDRGRGHTRPTDS